jgi:hypothetical protein
MVSKEISLKESQKKGIQILQGNSEVDEANQPSEVVTGKSST